MMQRKELYTNITLLPSSVPRQLALDILHSHSEIITLSPLVLSHHPIKAPRHANADEYYSSWYEIIQRVQYVPGLGKMGSGKISFKGCFENVPWGLKTHTYPPMGIDLKSKWRVAGNEPHEEPDPKETRPLGVPESGLYLLEEVEIRCNMTLMSFVKSQLKAASKVLVERLIKKAELLDAGVLQAMFQDGKLRTFNPADRTSTTPFQVQTHIPQASAELPQSPTRMSRWGSISSSSSGPRAAPNYYQHDQGYRKSGVVELPDTSPSYQAYSVKQPDKGVPSELPVMEDIPREYR